MIKTIDKYVWPVLLIAGAVVCYVVGVDIPLEREGAWWTRFVYEMCHGNAWHLACNCVFLMALMVSGMRMVGVSYVLAYLIAATAPTMAAPTVGMSGVCYALMGMCSWQVVKSRYWYYHGISMLCIGAGLLFPGVVNIWLHLWCYMLGIAGGWLVGWLLGKIEPPRIIRQRIPNIKKISRVNGWRPKRVGFKYTPKKKRHRRKK